MAKRDKHYYWAKIQFSSAIFCWLLSVITWIRESLFWLVRGFWPDFTVAKSLNWPDQIHMRWAGAAKIAQWIGTLDFGLFLLGVSFALGGMAHMSWTEWETRRNAQPIGGLSATD